MLNKINSVIAFWGNKDENMANDEVRKDKSQNNSVKQGVPDKDKRHCKSNLNKIQVL